MKGFTLIELLITVGIIVILSYGGLLTLINYRGRQDLSLTARTIVAALRDAQSRSQSQEEGKLWGVRFDAGEKSYGIFSGATCVPEIFISKTNIKASLEFDDPAFGTKDSCFKKNSGASTSVTPIAVTLKLASNPSVKQTLTIYENGRIE